MNDHKIRPYPSPSIQRFLRSLISRISYLLPSNGASASATAEAATNVIDVLQNWLPLNAGRGVLYVETKGTGSLSILVQDAAITISLIATLPFGLPMKPITVFKLDGDGAVLGDSERVRFALLLLRRATWVPWQNSPNVKIEAEWTWATDLRPSPKWVAWREEASRAGLQLPTADHWLADAPGSAGIP